jgi:hypothetical protein
MYISLKAELARSGTISWLYSRSRFLELSATATEEKLHAVPEKLATSSVCMSVRYQVLRTLYTHNIFEYMADSSDLSALPFPPLGSLAKT